jgi:hypothetical protein
MHGGLPCQVFQTVSAEDKCPRRLAGADGMSVVSWAHPISGTLKAP